MSDNTVANKKYLIAIDSGTTSCRTIVFDHDIKQIACSQIEINNFFPHSGWVEQDPLEIWNAQLTTLQSAKNHAGIKSNDIACVGITNQRETIVLWNKETGLPVYNAIVWQDRRTNDYCQKLSENQDTVDLVHKTTGLFINPYFSATKIKWILENVPQTQKVLKENKLLCGTIDTWLIWKLTGGKVHATDVTNASRTMLFDIHKLAWSTELLELFNIPKEILPEVKNTADDFGIILPSCWSQRATGEVKIAGAVGDQQSALFGQLCTEVGMVKNTYGTGCFTLLNLGETPILSKNRLLTTVAWKFKNQKACYALEGSVFIAGAAIKWLRDDLRILYNSAESDFYAKLANQDTSHEVIFVPSFSGLGAPYWDSDARGAIFGLERGTKREHIVKAAIESIAYQSNDLLSAMEKDLNQKIKILKVDGGVSNSEYLMQFQASISNVEIHRPDNSEVTALGAAFFAGLHTGYWSNLSELVERNKINKIFYPQFDQKTIKTKIHNWQIAVNRCLGWKKNIES
ncbi:Glycerol kinase GlpK [[Mycoplasma] cavipharyngis]|uniref:glycerol kinase GlpK n=1 Tax=[Mycoplasma] cavipharyngis TaxID=92757 RepID=UPI003703C84E